VVWSDDFETNPYSGITGTWAVDNSLAQAGTRAIHPPLHDVGGGTDEMDIACGDSSHSELSFFYTGYKPTAGQTLKFYVDDVLYDTYGNTEYFGVIWRKVDLVVSAGKHHYRWVSSTDTASAAPYWVDGLVCRNNPVVANTTGQFYFEEGFVPPEVGGSFRIDNSLPQAGTFSTRSQALKANQTASMSFSCGCTAHSELSFYYTGYKPTAGQTLKFYVDDVLNHTYGNTEYFGVIWNKVDVVLPQGMHHYRWDVATDVDGQPPYWIDAIKCQ
jgi:hypothetical protein